MHDSDAVQACEPVAHVPGSTPVSSLECGLDRTYVGGIERGELNPSLTSVFKIADALGVGASEVHARAEAILAGSHRRRSRAPRR